MNERIINLFKNDLNVDIGTCKDISEIFTLYIPKDLEDFSKNLNILQEKPFLEKLKQLAYFIAQKNTQTKKYLLKNDEIKKKFPFLKYKANFEFISLAYLENKKPFMALYGVQGFLDNDGAYMILQGRLNKEYYKKIHQSEVFYNKKQDKFLVINSDEIKSISINKGLEIIIN